MMKPIAHRAQQFNDAPIPFSLISRVVPHLSRDALEGLVQFLIDKLDELDAPTEDLEPEEDACSAGDDFGSRPCPLPAWQHGVPAIHDDDEHSFQPVALN